jgi:hypothetical protein
MKDTKTQVRVRTSKRHKQLYNDFKRQNIGEAHTIFFISACIGYSMDQRRPLGKEGEDRFYDYTIKPREWTVYQSIFLKENDLDLQTIQEGEKIIRFIEEYANGGLHYIIENIPYCFDVHTDEECVLKESEAANFSSRLLSLIIQAVE